MTPVPPAAPAVPALPQSVEQTLAETPVSLDRFARIHIGMRARRLAGKFGPNLDRDDFAQEMTVDLLAKLPDYDPQKAQRTTFTKLVVDHQACRLVEHHGTLKRGRDCETFSLNETVDNGEGGQVEFGDTLDAQINCPGRSPEELHQLSLDMAAVLPQLSPELQRLCRELMAGKPLAEIERESRRPRNKLRQMVVRIREVFVAAALDDYL